LGLKADTGSYGAAPPTATLPNSRDGQPRDPFLGHDMEQTGPAGSGIGGNPAGTAVQMQLAQADGPGVNGIGAPAAYPSTGVPAAYPSTGVPAAYPTTGAPPFQFAPQGNPATIAVGQMPIAPNNDAAAARAQSETLLLSARKSLAVGDYRRATAAVDQAKNLGVRFAETDDSPATVEALIHRYADLMAQGAHGDSEANRHQYAALLLEEAQGLMLWREYDEAERLAGMASQQPVKFNPVEMRPDVMLQRIAAARVGGPGAAMRSDMANLAQANGQAGAQAPMQQQSQASINAKPQAVALTMQARMAIQRGDLARAEQLARQADGMVPDSAFGPQEDRPSLVMLEIQKARMSGGSGVVTASGVITAGGNMNDIGSPGAVARSIYNPEHDRSRVVLTADEAPGLPTPAAPQPSRAGAAPAMQLFMLGEKALTDGNHDEALRMFRQAYAVQEQLDPQTRQRLQDHLQMMSEGLPRPAGNGGLLESAASRQQVLIRQLASDISRLQGTAQTMREKDPKGALVVLQKARAMVESAPAELDPQARVQLLHRVDGSIQETQAYIQKNFAQIQLDEQNKKAHDDVDARQKNRLELSEKLASMVDEYNKLVEERRYPEAEIVAKRAAEVDPDNPVVHQMVLVSRTLKRQQIDMNIRDEKENNIVEALQGVDKAAIPSKSDFEFGHDAHSWATLTDSRHRFAVDNERHRSPGDAEIEQKLTTPVSLKFKQAPLGEVLNYLAKVTQVNLHIDPQGLQAEGVTTDQPVSIDLARDIQLKSALALILEPLNLNYIIKDEVLQITSKDKRHGQVYTKSYQVADLVIPIPNFGPDGNEGINGALNAGYKRLGYGGGGSGGGFAPSPVAVFASDNGAKSNTVLNPAVAAQIRQIGTGQVQAGQPQTSGNNFGPGSGPGGLKGGNGADFDDLINLITSTIAPQSWDSAGGAGSIAPFETNLTLVVSQTQEVHEQIADLLNQLRRLQDLQVTIEVRFITLDDDFLERMGVDFNVNIPAKNNAANVLNTVTAPLQNVPSVTPSSLIGLAPGSSGANGYTFSNNVTFQQGSFTGGNAAIPAFPGLTPDATPASFGFAILSDIQAYFVIQALQSDTRSNVLQAPKVTLFNGQQAFVSDTSQRPFVTSVIPVVGDFAAAQQPVITVLSEGTSLTVQAVVSPDRRFVRLTVVPFFSSIGDVQNFQFTGSTTTVNNSAAATGSDNTSSTSAGTVTTNEGTTVQLPTFNFVTVTTTVSVPDGGTVLLGGIKRLSEGRNESGVPILSKIPYINRLFKNTAIARTTESLMMMVTPRIIIQEEEESKLLGTAIQ
jgi:general secretion pathway protein D